MLDFFLVLGQVPGTRFFLTFNELFSAYSIWLTFYLTRREFIIARQGVKHIPLAYWLVVSSKKAGRPPKYLRSAFISRIKLLEPGPAVIIRQHPKFSYFVFLWKLTAIVFNSLVYESRIIRANLERHNRLPV
jgi:hypothetical protein